MRPLAIPMPLALPETLTEGSSMENETRWTQSKIEKHEITREILKESRKNNEECRVFDLDRFRANRELVQIEAPKFDDSEPEDMVSNFE